MQYRVLGPIKMNGQRIEAGAVISLSDEEAAPLLQSGAVECVDQPFTGTLKTLSGGGQ